MAFIFGFRTLEEIKTALCGRLNEILTKHFTKQSLSAAPGHSELRFLVPYQTASRLSRAGKERATEPRSRLGSRTRVVCSFALG